MLHNCFFSYSFETGGLELVLINTKKLYRHLELKNCFNLIIVHFISAESCLIRWEKKTIISKIFKCGMSGSLKNMAQKDVEHLFWVGLT